MTWTESRYDKRPIHVNKLIYEQAKVSYCRQPSSTIGLAGSTVNYDSNRFLICTVSINVALQKVVLTSYRERLLYHLQCPALAGHLGEKHMFYSMQRKYYWPHIANDNYTTVRFCGECNKIQPSEMRKPPLQNIPRKWSIETYLDGTSRITSEDAEQQPLCTRNDKLLHKVRESRF